MTTNRDWKTWKMWVSIALAVPLALDLGLAVYLWQGSHQDPRALRAERDHLAIEAKLLQADVRRGQEIQFSLPQVGRDSDAFYRESFLNASTGYSRIESDLGTIASQSGVKTSGFTFKQKDIPDRGVTEISITTDIDADYPAIIQFINGLERSKNFYLLDHLQLASASTGGLRLQLGLHTYFRT
jgi:hypothetical protein